MRLLRLTWAVAANAFSESVRHRFFTLFFQKNLHLTKGQADAEVVRLSLSPTDGLSYIVGMDRILEMRGYYERTEAKYFDLRKFHTLFLRMGEIPIERIADEMRRQKREEKKIIR